MDIPCRYVVSDPPIERGQRDVSLYFELRQGALLMLNLYGLLLRMEHPSRAGLVGIYGETETNRRETVARDRIVPVLSAARAAGMPVIYVSDSAPNIALEGSHVREVMTRHLAIDPLSDYAEACNDPREYLPGEDSRIAYAAGLSPQASDYYVRKWTLSGFHATWLDRLLRDLGTTTLFCGGFNGDSDLLCTMLEGHYLGYRMVLLRECFAAVHMPPYEPEMDLTTRLVLYAEGRLGYTASAADLEGVLRCAAHRGGGT